MARGVVGVVVELVNPLVGAKWRCLKHRLAPTTTLGKCTVN